MITIMHDSALEIQDTDPFLSHILSQHLSYRQLERHGKCREVAFSSLLQILASRINIRCIALIKQSQCASHIVLPNISCKNVMLITITGAEIFSHLGFFFTFFHLFTED